MACQAGLGQAGTHLEARALASPRLLLDGHDLHDLVLQDGAEEELHNLVLLDGHREQEDVLELLDLALQACKAAGVKIMCPRSCETRCTKPVYGGV